MRVLRLEVRGEGPRFRGAGEGHSLRGCGERLLCFGEGQGSFV